MTQHWGTDINPAFFVEVPDPSNPGQTKRPDAGTTLMVQSAPDQVSQNPITIGTYGYWQYSLANDAIGAINVSSDGGATWVGPLYSRESGENQNNAGTNAAAALAATTSLGARVGILETSGVGGGGSGSSTVDGITDAGSIGKVLMKAPDATTARTAIGAGTSNLVVGTTSTTAKAGDYKPPSTDISDSTATGRALIKAADATAAKAAMSLDQVNNTSDANKPVSALQAAALAGKQATIPQFATQAAADAARLAGSLTAGQLLIVLSS